MKFWNRLTESGALRALRSGSGTDWDGIFTLGLSGLLFVSTLGMGILPSLIRVYRTAKNSAIIASSGSTILLFGKKLCQEQIDSEYQRRLRRAAQIIHNDDRRLTIILGGPSTSGGISEAAAGAEYLRSLGIPLAKIILEQQSRHTLDNLRNARDIVYQDHNQHTLLISNRYHLARCSHIANSLGIRHAVCAAEDKLEMDWGIAKKMLKEAYFIFWFQIAVAWASSTHNRRILARLT